MENVWVLAALWVGLALIATLLAILDNATEHFEEGFRKVRERAQGMLSDASIVRSPWSLRSGDSTV